MFSVFALVMQNVKTKLNLLQVMFKIFALKATQLVQIHQQLTLCLFNAKTLDHYWCYHVFVSYFKLIFLNLFFLHKYLLHHESLSFKNLPSEAESLTHIPSVATVPGVSFWVCFQLKGVKTGASALRTYMSPQCHTHTLNNTQLLTYTPTHTHTHRADVVVWMHM